MYKAFFQGSPISGRISYKSLYCWKGACNAFELYIANNGTSLSAFSIRYWSLFTAIKSSTPRSLTIGLFNSNAVIHLSGPGVNMKSWKFCQVYLWLVTYKVCMPADLAQSHKNGKSCNFLLLSNGPTPVTMLGTLKSVAPELE